MTLNSRGSFVGVLPEPPAGSLARISPFQAPLLRRRGPIGRLLRLRDDAGAAAALAATLAGRDPREVTQAEIEAALWAWGAHGRRAREILRATWGQALKAFTTDDAVSDAEAAYLASLRRLLNLSDRETATVEHAIVAARYRLAAGEALADARLTPAEREGLERLYTALRVPEEIHRVVWTELAAPLVRERLDEAIADRRLSPHELDEVRAYAESLGIVELQFDTRFQALVDRFSLLWRIENGQLPSVAAPITLEAGENCFWSGEAEWHESRGASMRTGMRAMKGLHLRAGSVARSPVTRDELRRLDAGTLYITSERILLRGAQNGLQLRHASVFAMEVFSDAIRVEKASGRGPVLVMPDPEVPAAILAAVLAAQG
jgi:hypothetical protein